MPLTRGAQPRNGSPSGAFRTSPERARQEAGALGLSYARIQRAGAPSLFTVHLAAEPGAAEARLTLDAAFLKGWRLLEA